MFCVTYSVYELIKCKKKNYMTRNFFQIDLKKNINMILVHQYLNKSPNKHHLLVLRKYITNKIVYQMILTW